MTRHPAVAGQFYPGDALTLSRAIADMLPGGSLQKKSALAAISPHAGYIYSGKVAAETFARVKIPRDVVLLGPNHRGHGAQIAIMRQGQWEMPLGDIPLNEQLAGRIIEQEPDLIVEDESAHRLEHSLEVQVPFLQYLQRELRLAPLVLSRLSYPHCERLGIAIAAAIGGYGQPVLIVASTDMTHYESRKTAANKDRQAVRRIEELDPEGLYRTVATQQISMCGVIPTTVALIAAIKLGAQRVELIRYTDSGEASGDLDQVVGYAGLIID